MTLKVGMWLNIMDMMVYMRVASICPIYTHPPPSPLAELFGKDKKVWSCWRSYATGSRSQISLPSACKPRCKLSVTASALCLSTCFPEFQPS